jgi:CRISPR-associated protein Cas5d
VDETEQPVPVSEELGQMLLDVNYDPETGRGTPVFFSAQLQEGVLQVPQRTSEGVVA